MKDQEQIPLNPNLRKLVVWNEAVNVELEVMKVVKARNVVMKGAVEQLADVRFNGRILVIQNTHEHSNLVEV